MPNTSEYNHPLLPGEEMSSEQVRYLFEASARIFNTITASIENLATVAQRQEVTIFELQARISQLESLITPPPTDDDTGSPG